jgi:hypothetical protein
MFPLAPPSPSPPSPARLGRRPDLIVVGFFVAISQLVLVQVGGASGGGLRIVGVSVRSASALFAFDVLSGPEEQEEGKYAPDQQDEEQVAKDQSGTPINGRARPQGI